MGRPLSVPPAGFDELPVEAQIEYVQALWDRIASRQRDVPSPAWHRAEVTAALGAHHADPEAARPWSEIRAELEARLKQG